MNKKSHFDFETHPGLNEDELNLHDYLFVISRYKWSIIILTAIITILAAIHVNSLTPIYRATATILVEPQDENIISIEQVYGAGQRYYEYYQTQLGILKSRDLAERIVDRLDLTEHPYFNNHPKPENAVSDTGLLKFLPAVIRDYFNENKNEEALSGTIVTRDSVAAQVMGMLQASIIIDSQLFQINYDSTNPELAALLANALAEVYIERELESRLETTKKASSWITDQLKELKEKVDQSELALQEFLKRENLIDAKGVDTLALNQMNELTRELVDAKRSRSELEELHRQIVKLKGQPVSAYESIPSVLNNISVSNAKSKQSNAEQKVSELAKRYGPKHPKMISAVSELESANQSLETQILNVIEAINKEYSIARAKEQHLSGALNSTKQDIAQINTTSHELKTLEYEVQSNRELYDMFLTRFKETTATDDLRSTNASIVDKAIVPGSPYKPDKKKFIIIAFILALAFNLLIVFLIEKLDNTLNDSLQVENRLLLPVLSILPKVGMNILGRNKAMRYYTEYTHTSFSENIRTIRTSILLSDIDNQKKVVLVTSSVPEEGKSIVSINLSLSLGQMGKTLLIDGDMRKPSIARVFNLDAKKTGLSHFVTGTKDLKDCLIEFPDENIFVMPAGQIPSNPLEILSSARFEKALDVLKDKFDYIVIDSAPAVPVSDPVVLSRFSCSTIYIVKAGSTPYQLAKAGLKKLKQVDANIIGIVLNQVTPAKKPGRYGHYQSDYYTYYGYGKT